MHLNRFFHDTRIISGADLVLRSIELEKNYIMLLKV